MPEINIPDTDTKAENETSVISEESQLLFMQIRLIRLAKNEWKLPLDKVLEIFRVYEIYKFIEDGYGIFHCEGDEAVFEDIMFYLERKGLVIYDALI